MKDTLFKRQFLEYYDIEDRNAYIQLGKTLLTEIKKNINNNQEIVILCIGTDRATGDCLGPLVGNELKKRGVENVFGTLKNPVHVLNLKETLEEIKCDFTNPYIIAIDASLGITKHIGYITLSNSPIEPGRV